MKEIIRHTRRGHRIIIVALAIVALRVFASLAVNGTGGGNAHPNRWWTQDVVGAAPPPSAAAAARPPDSWEPARPVNAPVTAVMEPMLSIAGVRPFGVPLQLIQDTDPGAPFTITFSLTGTVQWTTRSGQPITFPHAGWMNLGYVWNQGEDPIFPRAVDASLNTSTLRDWMANGWPGTLYADCEWDSGCRYGDYVHTKPGINASAICEAPVQSTIYVPIYDAFPDCETEIPDPKPPCPYGGICYHIVGFAGIEITDCNLALGQITAQWMTAHRPNVAYLRKSVIPSTAEPGQVITYTLVYTNYGPQTLTDAFITDSLPITLTNPSYTYSRAQITATGSSSYTWQVEALDVGEGGIITITAEIASGAPAGILTNTATITATELDASATSNTDHATIAITHVPGVALGPDHTGNADPASTITYTHVLTNTGNGPDTFTLDVASSQGWPVALMGGAYPTGTLHLPLQLDAGMTATLLVSLTVPAGSGGLTGVTTITATSQADADVRATATDTTIVNVLAPGVPTLLAPPDRAVTTTQAINFTWTPTTTGAPPTGYNLKLDGTIVVTTAATTAPAILSTGPHTWTVRAFNSFGYSAWAPPWQVEIIQYHIYLPLVLKN